MSNYFSQNNTASQIDINDNDDSEILQAWLNAFLEEEPAKSPLPPIPPPLPVPVNEIMASSTQDVCMDTATDAVSAEDSTSHDDASLNTKNQNVTFPYKLSKIMKDEANKEAIGWNENGQIVIKDVEKFQKILVENKFKSTDMKSFARQMNNYGVSKVKNQYIYSQKNITRDSNLEELKLKKNTTKQLKQSNEELENRVEKLEYENKKLKDDVSLVQAENKDIRSMLTNIKALLDPKNLNSDDFGFTDLENDHGQTPPVA